MTQATTAIAPHKKDTLKNTTQNTKKYPEITMVIIEEMGLKAEIACNCCVSAWMAFAEGFVTQGPSK